MVKQRTPRKRKVSSREHQFARLWEALNPQFAKYHPFQTEHRFHAERQWRFDFAWPAVMVAVEIEGGTWGRRRGRHTTGSGHQADCEKYNAAAIDGWCVLRFTSKDLQSRPAQVIDEVMEAIRTVIRRRQAATEHVDNRKWE